MSRKSPFQSSQFGKSLEQSRAEAQTIAQQSQNGFTGDSHLQGIPTTDKKMRSREWEKANQPMLFRGVPIVLKEAIKEIAADLHVRADDVGRAFLEYGLLCHERGEIRLAPVLSEQRLTLFPKQQNGWGKIALPGWYEKIWDQQPPVKKPRKRNRSGESEPKPWQQQVSYRGIPGDVQDAIRSLHQQTHVPLGEVAIMLLGHSLEAYRTGKLVLNPQHRQASGVSISEEMVNGS